MTDDQIRIRITVTVQDGLRGRSSRTSVVQRMPQEDALDSKSEWVRGEALRLYRAAKAEAEG